MSSDTSHCNVWTSQRLVHHFSPLAPTPPPPTLPSPSQFPREHIHSPLSFNKSNTLPSILRIVPRQPFPLHPPLLSFSSTPPFTSAHRHASASFLLSLLILPSSIQLQIHAHLKKNDSDTHLGRRVICDTGRDREKTKTSRLCGVSDVGR